MAHEHHEWEQVGRTPDETLRNTRTTFFFLLHQRNLDQLNRIFDAVSDPTSPEYRQFKSEAEIRAITAAPQQDQDRVMAYLRSEPVRSTLRYRDIQNFGDAIEVQGAVLDGVEKLLGTQFHDLRSRTHPERMARRSTTMPVVPAEIADVVPGFIGLTESPPVHIDGRMEAAAYEQLRAQGYNLQGMKPVRMEQASGAGASADVGPPAHAVGGFTLRSSSDMERAAMELPIAVEGAGSQAAVSAAAAQSAQPQSHVKNRRNG